MTLLLILLATVTACVCAGEVLGLRYRRIAFQRRGESLREFQAHFRRAGVHPDVPLAAHEFFEQRTGVRGFPVRPGDALLPLFGMQREDVHDAVAVLAASAHCLPADAPAPTAYDDVATVEDLVHAVHALHRQARSPAAAGQRPRSATG